MVRGEVTLEEIIIKVSENENVYKRLLNEGLDYKKILPQIDVIAKEINSNKIGYFQFKLENKILKVFIIPKIFNNSTNLFYQYITIFYRLKTKYDRLNGFIVDDTLVDIGIREGGDYHSNSFEQLLISRYSLILNYLENFFRKFKSSLLVNTSVTSQSINNKLDMRKNILEVNKASIHQYKDIEMNYAIEACITYRVLEIFVKKILVNLENVNDLKVSVKKIMNFLKTKFKLEYFNFKIQDVTKFKIKKYFRTKSQKKLYNYLLLLLGLEVYNEVNGNSSSLGKVEKMVSLCFEADRVYEYYVLDKLINTYGDNVKFKEYMYYNLIGYAVDRESSKFGHDRKSNPDYIIHSNEIKIVADAKWKVISNYSDIKFEDLTKLNRDCKLHGSKLGILIYPKIHLDYNEDEVLRFNFQDDGIVYQILEFDILDYLKV